MMTRMQVILLLASGLWYAEVVSVGVDTAVLQAAEPECQSLGLLQHSAMAVKTGKQGPEGGAPETVQQQPASQQQQQQQQQPVVQPPSTEQLHQQLQELQMKLQQQWQGIFPNGAPSADPQQPLPQDGGLSQQGSAAGASGQAFMQAPVGSESSDAMPQTSSFGGQAPSIASDSEATGPEASQAVVSQPAVPGAVQFNQMYSQEPMMVNAAARDDAIDAAVAAPAQAFSPQPMAESPAFINQVPADAAVATSPDEGMQVATGGAGDASSDMSLLGEGCPPSCVQDPAPSCPQACTKVVYPDYPYPKGKAPPKSQCTPKCTWKCDQPECDEVCVPQCKQPTCEVRCEPNVDDCQMDCSQPQCMTLCPERACPMDTGCPHCETHCSDPKCMLKCPQTQKCHTVCEQPECSWNCKAPSQCPKPQCQMVCQRPPNCLSQSYQQMPPRKSGEKAVRSFMAPVATSGTALGNVKATSAH